VEEENKRRSYTAEEIAAINGKRLEIAERKRKQAIFLLVIAAGLGIAAIIGVIKELMSEY